MNADLIVMFLFGMATGFIMLLIVTLHFAVRSIARRKKSVEDFLTQADSLLKTNAVVEERMKKVKEITLRQLDLQGQIETPQKSGLDGKHKNTLGQEIKTLEEQKVALLNSLLAEGHDPVLTVSQIDGSTETVKLSEFLYQQGILAPEPPPATTTTTAKKFGKFVVYSNDDKGKSNT